MRMSIKHIAMMLGVGAVVVAVLAAFGMPLTTALFVALIAACPLMMFMMMGGNGMNHGMNHDQETKTDGNAHVHR